MLLRQTWRTFKKSSVEKLYGIQGRYSHFGRNGNREENMKMGYYMAATAVFVFGVSYASVPLYKVFCQMTGFGGTTQRADEVKSTTVKPVIGAKVIRIDFTSDVHSAMPWKFKPTQKSVRVIPGETALAFYTVTNPTDKAISGVATYNVYPPKAGLYFNKIQCFCFEEQRLSAHETIDMPVFFFIDPEFVDDPAMESVNTITLSYTFFKTGEEIPEKYLQAAKLFEEGKAKEAKDSGNSSSNSKNTAESTNQTSAPVNDTTNRVDQKQVLPVTEPSTSVPAQSLKSTQDSNVKETSP